MFRRNFLKTMLCTLAISLAGPVVAFAEDRASADDAIAMVERALTLYQDKGFESTKAVIGDTSNKDFNQGELYVFMVSMDGTITGHGVSPKLIGKNIYKLKDADGKQFIAEFVKVMKKSEQGEVDYKWKNPSNNKIENKRVFLRRTDDNSILGVGIYTAS